MTGNEYQKLAMRTCAFNLDRLENLESVEQHALFGLSAEVGEVHSIFQKYYQGHPIEDEQLQEELGDVLWMVAEMCYANFWSLENIMEKNIEKLKKRYPDGFDPEKSLHREN